MIPILLIVGVTAAALLLATGLLHLIPRLGAAGKRLSEALCHAPALDLLITYFTVLPLIVGPVVGSVALGAWPGIMLGLLAGIVGQVASVLIWMLIHELAHPAARRGPRIVKVLDRIVGRWRNLTGVWVTAPAVPVFWMIRVAQTTLYPPLTWLVRLPRYDSRDWVNVSRHKFAGLVGHDLIWCLYCDWMTGVWALGSEMLRNVESFWCPIRFHSRNKCENCAICFPDVFKGWVSPDATMEDVVRLLEEKYPGRGANQWFGHPARLTVEGKSPTETADSEPPP